jgi:hypothetical protein
MSATRHHPERLVALSLAIYEALLVLYPKPFRRVYATEMARVFRDSCRAATQRDGVAGLARIWRVTLGDLVITVWAERTEQGMSMTRSALYRAAGAVSLFGIAVWILVLAWLTWQTLILRQNLDPMMFIILQAKWSFFVIGFIGLYAWLSAHRGALVWLPGAIAIATLLAMIAGGMYYEWASQVGVSGGGSVTIVDLGAASAVNQQVDYYAYVAINQGFPVIGLALLVTGWMIRATQGLRGASRALIVMGAISFIYYFFTDMGAPSLLRNTGTPGLIGLIAGALVFTVVWLGGWLLLGRQLWQAGATAEQVSTAAVSGEE